MSPGSFLYCTPAGDADTPVMARLLSHAFAGAREQAGEWLNLIGRDQVRTLRDPSGVVRAMLARIPMAQYFGGRSVPMVGIAGVAVGPEMRGRGLARQVMRQGMIEAAAEGFPLSALYASTQPLYRQVGYEQAGGRWLLTIPLVQIDVKDRSGPLESLEAVATDEVHTCYRAFAQRFDGHLDRPDYIWKRIHSNRGDVHYGFLVRDGGGVGRASSPAAGAVTGYCYLRQVRNPVSGRQDLFLSDIAFTTNEAARRLLGFLADFAPMGDTVTLPAGPGHPLILMLAQQRYTLAIKDSWMIRVLDVPKAVAARGFNPALNAEAHLDITDDLIPANHGRWTIRVRNGQGIAEKGGNGEIAMNIRALAPLYSGHASPQQLELAGLLTGAPAALASLRSIFPQGCPWMADMF